MQCRANNCLAGMLATNCFGTLRRINLGESAAVWVYVYSHQVVWLVLSKLYSRYVHELLARPGMHRLLRRNTFSARVGGCVTVKRAVSRLTTVPVVQQDTGNAVVRDCDNVCIWCTNPIKALLRRRTSGLAYPGPRWQQLPALPPPPIPVV